MWSFSVSEQMEQFMDGVDFGDQQIEIFMHSELQKRLEGAMKEDRPLRVYCGYDVTGPDLHLGHTVTLKKLRQFQEMGHDVTFVIGTFTSLIGDPSDRETARKTRSIDLIMRESELYAKQAYKILDSQNIHIRFNHEWLNALKLIDILSIASHFSFQQLVTRENIRKRLDRNDPVQFQEIIYPLAQAYDAVVLKADVQLGATEQLFNLMIGRKLQEQYGQSPQICLTLPILVGTDGEKRMSKSAGNYIGISESPHEKYRKLMQLPSHALPSYIRLLTRWSPNEKNKMISAVQEKTGNIYKIQHKVALEIISSIDGEKATNMLFSSSN